MSRRTSTFLLVSSLLTGCLAAPSDGPAPALTGTGERAVADEGDEPAKPEADVEQDTGRAPPTTTAPDAGAHEAELDAGPPSPTDEPTDAGRDDAAAEPVDGGQEAGDADLPTTGDDAGEPESRLACAVSATLMSRCVGCHGPGARSGVELDALAKLGVESAKFPGELLGERALARMRDTDRPMPPRGELVPEPEIAALEAWLRDGRPEDSSCP